METESQRVHINFWHILHVNEPICKIAGKKIVYSKAETIGNMIRIKYWFSDKTDLTVELNSAVNNSKLFERYLLYKVKKQLTGRQYGCYW